MGERLSDVKDAGCMCVSGSGWVGVCVCCEGCWVYVCVGGWLGGCVSAVKDAGCMCVSGGGWVDVCVL